MKDRDKKQRENYRTTCRKLISMVKKRKGLKDRSEKLASEKDRFKRGLPSYIFLLLFFSLLLHLILFSVGAVCST